MAESQLSSEQGIPSSHWEALTVCRQPWVGSQMSSLHLLLSSQFDAGYSTKQPMKDIILSDQDQPIEWLKISDLA